MNAARALKRTGVAVTHDPDLVGRAVNAARGLELDRHVVRAGFGHGRKRVNAARALKRDVSWGVVLPGRRRKRSECRSGIETQCTCRSDRRSSVGRGVNAAQALKRIAQMALFFGAPGRQKGSECRSGIETAGSSPRRCTIRDRRKSSECRSGIEASHSTVSEQRPHAATTANAARALKQKLVCACPDCHQAATTANAARALKHVGAAEEREQRRRSEEQ